jgi:hypothetical protein
MHGYSCGLFGGWQRWLEVAMPADVRLVRVHTDAGSDPWLCVLTGRQLGP